MDQSHYEELRKLKAAASSNKDARLRLKEELSGLTNSEKAEFARKMKLDDELEKPAKNDFRGVKHQKGKIALIEHTNQHQDFLLKSTFLAMENYIFDRFRLAKQFTSDEQSVITKFLNSVFEHNSSGHVDSVYDVFVKPMLKERDESLLSSTAQINPAFIPNPRIAEFNTFAQVVNMTQPHNYNIIKCNFADEELNDALAKEYSELVHPITTDEFQKFGMTERWFICNKGKLVPMPSYSQVRNASNYFINKFEEHRFLTSVIFQQKPERELLVHLHGLFDSIEKADEYRVKESSNIHDKVFAMPVGYSVLSGDFRSNQEGTVIYNPSDPDIELMVNGKQNIRRAESRVMKKRTMSKLHDRADPETMKAIREFNKAKELLRTEGEKKVREKYSASEVNDKITEIRNAESLIDKKINDALQFLGENELLFNTLKVKDGKMEKGEDYVVNFDQ